MNARSVIVIEDDPFPRILQVILDPRASASSAEPMVSDSTMTAVASGRLARSSSCVFTSRMSAG